MTRIESSREYPNLLPDVDPDEVEGTLLRKGDGPGELEPRVFNALGRSRRFIKPDTTVGYWDQEKHLSALNGFNAGVLAETPEEMLTRETVNLGPVGVGKIKDAIRHHARKG